MEATIENKISGEELKKKLTYILESKNQGLRDKYHDYMVPFQASLFPIDVRQIYPGFESYTLELGCGWGEFGLEQARRYPRTFYVALDKKKYRIKKSIKDQIQEHIPNLRWMVCHLEWIFKGLFKESSIDKVIINFPDPWPKIRHQKHRFVDAELIQELSRITRIGGMLEFATDSWSYMEEVLGVLNNFSDWKNIYGTGVILPALPDRPVSFFESLKRREGENVYIIQLHRI